MNKTELIEAIASSTGLTKVDTSRFIESFVGTITEALKDGIQVVIPGFGTFQTSERAARNGRNPRTGETIHIEATKVAKFRVGKLLKEAVQD